MFKLLHIFERIVGYCRASERKTWWICFQVASSCKYSAYTC